MTAIRVSIFSIAMLTLAAVAPAFAQSPALPPPAEKSAGTLSAKMEEVSKWTKQQWYAAKAVWSKQKVKWADCQKQALDSKLSGRKSWPFLYACMTKTS